ncbi:alpha/beta hydrolase [Nonomuraea diastatica]|uniref:Alpha/beta hydrolase n=1 Tax=Nonomuraea diastatica TaxID=1848329 RepID=A0A4R4W5Q0_9ACTN|nr:alpha/beta hydrolase [Nonomuraea diastatica]TDD13959.1 alpha/beta hydrolase [Nonomuraea diastatica]
MVATILAGRRPDRVTALVLINTGPSLDALIAAGSAAIGPTPWPPTDEQIRQFSRPARAQHAHDLRQGRVRPGTFHGSQAIPTSGLKTLRRKVVAA